MDDLQVDCNTFSRLTCCGKAMHKHCSERVNRSKMSPALKSRCPECRQKKPTSEKEQVKQIRVWVDKNKPWAQTSLAYHYQLGRGVPLSYEQAIQYYTMAIKQGDPNAMYGLAGMYDRGQGITQSFEKAAEVYALAANQEHASAQFNLGLSYARGQGVAQSYEKTIELYTLAANQGVANAQGSLGILYYNGEGTAQSNAMARKWFLKAALQEDELAIKYCKHLDEMEGKTTPTLPCCAACGTHETTRRPLKNCQQCHTTHYCNRDCQMKHWNEGHKRQCKQLRKENEKEQVAAGGEK